MAAFVFQLENRILFFMLKLKKEHIFFIFIFLISFLSACEDKYRANEAENTVKIGLQEWMPTNLDVSVFRNGDSIPEAKTDEEWKNAAIEGTPA